MLYINLRPQNTETSNMHCSRMQGACLIYLREDFENAELHFFNSRFTFIQHCRFTGNFGCLFTKSVFSFQAQKHTFQKHLPNKTQNNFQNKTQHKLLKPSYKNILGKQLFTFSGVEVNLLLRGVGGGMWPPLSSAKGACILTLFFYKYFVNFTFQSMFSLCFLNISMFSVCFFENLKHFSKRLPNNIFK